MIHNDNGLMGGWRELEFAVKRLRVSLCMPLGDLLTGATIREYKDLALGRLVLQLDRRLVSKTETEDVGWYEHPADWWEGVKERWFPAWAKRRWPVRMHRVEKKKEVTRMCPHLRIPSGDASHVRWLMREPDDERLSYDAWVRRGKMSSAPYPGEPGGD